MALEVLFYPVDSKEKIKAHDLQIVLDWLLPTKREHHSKCSGNPCSLSLCTQYALQKSRKEKTGVKIMTEKSHSEEWKFWEKNTYCVFFVGKKIGLK